MSHLEPPPMTDPAAARLYDADRARFGYVANYTRVLALRPAALEAWQALGAAVKSTMDLRRFELATFAAARRLRSRYCSLAHAKVLRDRFYDDEALERIAADHHAAGLSEVDVAVMDFADRVAGDPNSVTAEHVRVLRGLGLTDPEILDVALTAAARCFFSTVIAAAGAEPDPAYDTALAPGVRAAVGQFHGLHQAAGVPSHE
ncbi:peroxidase [Dactylosporangium salmoneum]|uniref:Peroxidase-related enzyme n=1 Tax=Dactylosporangium salmoneum TaxID=53361 RepID=A0ABP5URR8_9ACTN